MALGVAAIVLLAGCGGGAPTGADGSETTPPAPAATASSAPDSAGDGTEPAKAAQGGRELHAIALELQPVAELAAPIAMAVRPNDEALYVAERGGRIRALRDGTPAEQPLLDISEGVSTEGERGLLGFTFSESGDEVYVSYTNVDGDSRVDAYPLDGDRAVVDQRRELLAVEQPYANHNGGNLLRGPDGMLYLGLGDGGGAGDPERAAQDPTTLLGKMVRIEPGDGSAPDDNPFVDDGEFLPEIFALGLRNPWRFSFDRKTGDLWVGDVGQNRVEEVNVTPAAKSAGRNYGWSIIEGTREFRGTQAPGRAVEPVVEYATGEDGCSVTGGFVYRGRAIPALRGAYLYSDYCGGWVRGVRVRSGQVTDSADLGISSTEVASFGEDADGELYVLSLGGTVSKIVPG